MPTSIIVKESPTSTVMYKGDKLCYVVQCSSDVSYVNFEVNGVAFRKPLINNHAYFDVSDFVRVIGVDELPTDNAIVFSQSDLVQKVTVKIRGYTSTGTTTSLIEDGFTYVNELPLSFEGIDNSAKLNIFAQQQEIWIPCKLRNTATSNPSQLCMKTYYNGLIVNTTDLEDVPYPDYFWYANHVKLVYPLIGVINSIQIDIVQKNDGSIVYATTNPRQVNIIENCIAGTDTIIVWYLDRFGRWASYPIFDYVNYTIDTDLKSYDLVENKFNYNTNTYTTNNRPNYNVKTSKTIWDLETGMLTDADNLLMAEIISSKYHYLTVQGKRYYAQLKTSNYTQTLVKRDGLKSLKLKFEVKNDE